MSKEDWAIITAGILLLLMTLGIPGHAISVTVSITNNMGNSFTGTQTMTGDIEAHAKYFLNPDKIRANLKVIINDKTGRYTEHTEADFNNKIVSCEYDSLWNTLIGTGSSTTKVDMKGTNIYTQTTITTDKNIDYGKLSSSLTDLHPIMTEEASLEWNFLPMKAQTSFEWHGDYDVKSIPLKFEVS